MDESTIRTNVRVAEAIVSNSRIHDLLTAMGRLRYRIGPADIEDSLQETAKRLLEYCATVRDPGAFAFIAFRNYCLRLSRRVARESGSNALAIEEIGERRSSMQRADDRIAVREALAAISLRCRKLLIERYLLGRSRREVARSANLADSSVSRVIDRCLKKLRESLR